MYTHSHVFLFPNVNAAYLSHTEHSRHNISGGTICSLVDLDLLEYCSNGEVSNITLLCRLECPLIVSVFSLSGFSGGRDQRSAPPSEAESTQRSSELGH